jgi:uncharacterized membrane protein
MTFAASVSNATEDPGLLSRMVLALVLGASGLLVAASGQFGASGRLRRNRVAGIRTRRSLASDEAWRTVHRGAAPWFYASGACLLLGGMAAAFVAAGDIWLCVVLGATGLSVLLALLATWRGHRALDRQERA